MELIQIYFTREERELIHKAVYEFQDSFDEPDEDCVRICKVINNTLN